ncbi:MAG: hypothetical protein ACFE0J_03845 [Elainellaceae cyanobacterium]
MLISILALWFSLFSWKRLNDLSSKKKIRSSALNARLNFSKEFQRGLINNELDQRLKEVEYISHLRDQIESRSVYKRTGRLLQYLSALEKDLSHPNNTDEDRRKLEVGIKHLSTIIKDELGLTRNYEEGIIKEIEFLKRAKNTPDSF